MIDRDFFTRLGPDRVGVVVTLGGKYKLLWLRVVLVFESVPKLPGLRVLPF